MTFLILPVLVMCLTVKLTSPGPALYWSRRVGRFGEFFMMPKIRSMYITTPETATSTLKNPDLYLTRIGSFLRRNSIDELPQFFSVLIGDMSVVGPRPALHDQLELIANRKGLGIDELRPGITGWAQVNGRDAIALSCKIQLDLEYLQRSSIFFDFKIIVLTVFAVLKSKDIRH